MKRHEFFKATFFWGYFSEKYSGYGEESSTVDRGKVRKDFCQRISQNAVAYRKLQLF
jgi:hypothetical protein